MANSVDPDQLAGSNLCRSQLIWIYTVCKDRVYSGSAGQGLIHINKIESNCISDSEIHIGYVQILYHFQDSETG